MNESKKNNLKTNVLFDTSSLRSYLSEYAGFVKTALDQVPAENLDRFGQCLRQVAEAKRTVFVIGNGGSSAIADHLCCDFTKGTATDSQLPIRTMSLSAHTALYTALANDNGFETVFATQIDMYAEPGDILVAISSSGDSKNIINGAVAAKRKNLTVVGFTGFKGGALRDISDISIHVPFDNYGVVEDAHQILMHTFAQFIKAARDQKEPR